MKHIHYLIIIGLLLLTIGCKSEPQPAAQTKTKTQTTVNVNQYLMDAKAFDMASVIAKLKEGTVSDAEALQKFINETSGINNVDLDKDGSIDTVTVREEKGEGGNVVMAVVAHPKDDSKSATIAELGFEKNTTTNEVVISGSYPDYIQGHQEHYYRHALTGSTMGDMLFYSWLFRPHRGLYHHPYSYGMYGYGARPILRGSALTSTRTSYRTTNKITTVSPAKKPSSFKSKSSGAKTMAKKIGNKSKSAGSSLKSKAKSSKSFAKNTSPKKKASGFGAKKKSSLKKKSSWGSGSRKSFGRRSFGGGRRKSSVAYKYDIHYLNENELATMASEALNMPLTTWKYNGENQTHLGIIIEDVKSSVCIEDDGVDLYSYTSLAIAAAQVQAEQIEALSREVQALREYSVSCNER